MDDLTFWVAFQPVGLILLGVIVGAAFAFLAAFIFRTYRLRKSPQHYADLIAQLQPVDPPLPPTISTRPDEVAEELPPTHEEL